MTYKIIKNKIFKTLSVVLVGFFAMAGMAFAADTISSQEYIDADGDGTVDHIKLTFDANITKCSYDTTASGDWSVDTAGDINIAITDIAKPAGAVDGDCDGTDPVVYLTVTADANETGGSTAPVISYTNQGTADDLKDSAAITDKSNLTVADAAAPIITSNPGGLINVDENTTAVTTVTATESVTYSITGDADQAKFSIDGSGNLTFKDAPDFEDPQDSNTQNDYIVEVTVTDGAGLTASQHIVADVQNVNEAPVFTSANTVNAAENQTAVQTVVATDEDAGDVITYSITGGADQALFAIDGASGALTFLAAPNFEAPGDANADNDYVVEVTATDDDGAPLATAQTITVSVTDVNEAPTNITITSNNQDENLVNNTIGIFSTTDVDSGDTHSYSFACAAPGVDDGEFFINGGNQLRIAGGNSFDFETKNSYSICLRTTDAGGLTYDKNFTITVNDVNEAPVITSNGGWATAAVNVAENSTAVTTVTSTDEDVPAQTLTYSITGGADQTKFAIDASTGSLTFQTAPDYENPQDADTNNTYIVEVTVTDNGAGTLTDVQTVTVTVTDVSEGHSGPRHSSSSKTVTYTCKDSKATNFSNTGTHKQSLCEYAKEEKKEEKEEDSEKPKEEKTSQCSADMILTENLKAGDRNGRYSSWAKKTITQAHILQKHLNRLGFNAGVEDGILGKNSTAAIKRLQKFLGVIQDGYVGPKTRAALNASCTGEEIVGNDKDEHGCIGSAGYVWNVEQNKCVRPWEKKAEEKKEEKTSQCSADMILTENLKAGDRNGRYSSWAKKTITQAHILQKHLNRLGFNAGVEDGILGKNSTAAIKRLQKFLGVIQDGYVGPKTRAALNASCE